MGDVVASMTLSKKYLVVRGNKMFLVFLNLDEIDGACIHWEVKFIHLLNHCLSVCGEQLYILPYRVYGF